MWQTLQTPPMLCASRAKSWSLTSAKTMDFEPIPNVTPPTGTIRSGLFISVAYIRHKNQMLAHTHCHGAIAINLI